MSDLPIYDTAKRLRAKTRRLRDLAYRQNSLLFEASDLLSLCKGSVCGDLERRINEFVEDDWDVMSRRYKTVMDETLPSLDDAEPAESRPVASPAIHDPVEVALEGDADD